MKTASDHLAVTDGRSFAGDVVRAIFGLAWHIVRLPILAFLVILEPIVRLVLWGAAFLGTLTAFLFEFSGAVPDFPFWLMISISIGCMLLLGVYYVLLHLLS